MNQDLIAKLSHQYRGKKVLVVGLGLQGGGVGVARFFSRLGAAVLVTDQKSEVELNESISALQNEDNIVYHLGGHERPDFLAADVIFKGPSVRWDMPEIKAAIAKNTPIEMETVFFLRSCPLPVIGVTGTRGKSTTAAMIHFILAGAGKKAALAGNVRGVSTINLLNNISLYEFVVLELSSWQLSAFHRKKISPPAAVLTNFYPDHLNYYHSMDDYFYDKTAIFAYQSQFDILIANKNLQEKITGCRPKSRLVYFSDHDFPITLKNLTGRHNYENAQAAVHAAQWAGVEPYLALKSVAEFGGLPFRQQKIREIGGVIFINDTTATTPIAAKAAIEAFAGWPTIAIMGGNSKNLPLGDLFPALSKLQQLILLPGSFTDELVPFLETKRIAYIKPVFKTLAQASAAAFKEAKKLRSAAPAQPVVVLFSPGATSFAQFKNEFDRGEIFNTIIAKLL
ncbi:UDP-N-acetylmuramoyl-L-alanine--D-glutamate ligase [Candidatus Roizmanbacteria bacterium]|nr:UDP-N-acetylmuramoyl-L-alanine--D-glutamate ligase [Candidatus Roizmanbacteria bacterium]